MRDQIKEKAMTVIRSHGSQGLNFRDLGASLGIKSSSVHYYFPTKSDLLEEVVRDYTAQFLKELNQRASGAKNLNKCLEAVLSFFEESQKEQLICLCGALAAEYNAMDSKVNDAVRNFFETLEGWVEDKISKFGSQSELSAKLLSQVFVSLLEGALIMSRCHKSSSSLRSARQWMKTL